MSCRKAQKLKIVVNQKHHTQRCVPHGVEQTFMSAVMAIQGIGFRWDETAGLSGTSYDVVRNALEVQRRPANEEE
jgi:hypothetical protein